MTIIGQGLSRFCAHCGAYLGEKCQKCGETRYRFIFAHDYWIGVAMYVVCLCVCGNVWERLKGEKTSGVCQPCFKRFLEENRPKEVEVIRAETFAT